MDNQLEPKEQSKHSGKSRTKKLLLTGLPFLAAGFLIAAGINGIHPSFAGDATGATHVTTAAPVSIPSSFAGLAARLSPTVVNVKVTKIEQAGLQGQMMPGDPFWQFFGQFNDGRGQMPKTFRSHAAGSGVIISKDGYILTNNHVVEGAKEVTVTLSDEKEYPAKVIGTDPKTDLAVLKIDVKKDLPAATLGDSDKLRVGDWVMAIGNPFGLSHTVTSGIVSAKGRVIGAGPYDNFIQTDASINPGNSGGPLFNMNGEVVGINTAIIAQGQGIGFAIPISTAEPLIPQLEKNGKITRGYLGVNIQDLTPDLAKAMNIKETDGALVADVVSGSPADKSGIMRGDVIISYNGKAIKGSRDLPAKVAATPVGDKVTVTVLRDGQDKELNVTIAKLASDDSLVGQTGEPEKGKWGLQLHELTPQIGEQLQIQADKGVAVVGVEPGSAAAEAGIRQGDVIIEVNRKAVASVDDVIKDIKAGDKDHLLLLVQRQNGRFYVPLEMQG
jgi:serine protease Do